MMTSLALFGNKVLRTAIQQNLVTFPAQVPVFAKHEAGEMQARIVQLFFIGGWSIRKIANRYGLAPDKVRKTLTDWRVRAIASGYVQEVGPEVLPALASTSQATGDAAESETAEDRDDEGPNPDAPTEPARTALQVVAAPNAQTKPERIPERINVLHLLLEELEAGIERDAVWAPYRRRLLQILKDQCIQSGLTLSSVQAERVEAVMEVDPERAYDLLRDLNQRIRDEERCAAFAGNQGPGRNGLLHVLLMEIETAAREQNPGPATWPTIWPRHCGRFLMAIKQGCVDLGMEFSLAQVRRMEDALAADPQRLGDLIRDLQNRLADEQEHASLICVGRRLPRRLAIGSHR